MFQQGQRVDGPLFTVLGASGAGVSRLGVAVAKAVGGSVSRNRARRLLRESFRRLMGAEPALDLVILAKRPLATASQREVDDEFVGRLQALHKRLARRGGAPAAPRH